MFKKNSPKLTQEEIDSLCRHDDEELDQGEDTEVEPLKPAMGVEEYMKDILKDVASLPDEKKKEIQHLDYILALAAGERVISEPVKISQFITVRFASLTGRQRQVISGFITSPAKNDEEDKPIINQALNRQITMAMMWYSLNDKVLPDLMDRSVYATLEQMSHEMDARYNQVVNWPAEWTAAFEQAAIDFNKKIVEAVSEANVTAF